MKRTECVKRNHALRPAVKTRQVNELCLASAQDRQDQEGGNQEQ